LVPRVSKARRAKKSPASRTHRKFRTSDAAAAPDWENMNTFTFESSWDQIKGKLRHQFSHLTDDDVNFVEGKGEELLARLRSKLQMGDARLKTLLHTLQDEIDEAGGTVRGKFDSVKAAASHMADDLKGKAAEVVDELKHAASARAGECKGQAGEAYDHARQRARTLHEDAEEYVRQQPRKSLLTAVAVGFVAGLLLRH
jgi:ElaB/YqjD/DUF883 family membrane-anchored ribosome-binding protein